MKDPINNDGIENSTDDVDHARKSSDESRRNFLATSTGAIAAVAAATLVSDKASATWPAASDVSIPSN